MITPRKWRSLHVWFQSSHHFQMKKAMNLTDVWSCLNIFDRLKVMILRISVVFRHEMKLYERTFWGAFTYLFPSLVAGHFDQVALFHLVLGVLLRLSFEEIWAGALGGISGGISFWTTLENLRWNLTITQLKRNIIFQTIMTSGSMFIFQGCIWASNFQASIWNKNGPGNDLEHIPPRAGKPENHRLQKGRKCIRYFPGGFINHLKKKRLFEVPILVSLKKMFAEETELHGHVVATQICFNVHPYHLGKWSNLTNFFFQMGWFNHQLSNEKHPGSLQRIGDYKFCYPIR